MLKQFRVPAHELVKQITQKRYSPTEVAKAVIEHTNKIDPKLRAYIRRDDNKFEEWAKRSKEMLTGGFEPGKLFGLPISAKDLFDVAGFKNTAGGSPYFPIPGLHGPQCLDSKIFDLFRAAGAGIFGITNTPSGGLDWQAISEFQTTNNPYDLMLTSGGSSGGEAAAVALFMSYLGTGSDIAGSVRIPAAFCGIFSHKPTRRLVSLHGHYPMFQLPHPPPTLAAPGFFARDPYDLSIALNLTKEREIPDSRHTELKNFRVGSLHDLKACPLTSETSVVIRDFLGKLAPLVAGTQIREGLPSSISAEDNLKTFWNMLASDLIFLKPSSNLQELERLSTENPELNFILESWNQEENWRQLLPTKQDFYIQQWSEYFNNFDALIMPVCFTTAFPHVTNTCPDLFQTFANRRIPTIEGLRRYIEMAFWPSFATLGGLPATTIPIGRTKAGLPVGVQIVGPPDGDMTTIQLARLISEQLDLKFNAPELAF